MIFDLLGDDEREMQLVEDEYGVPFVQNLSNHEGSDGQAALERKVV
jgi:hypothetical protein